MSYSDYCLSYSDYCSTNMNDAATLAAFGYIWLFTMIVSIVTIVAMWKLFKKAGKPGWASIIPIYNTYTLFDIVYPGHGIKFLLMLIPFVNIYIGIKCYIDLAKAFGKSGAYALGLIFLNPIFMCILGFDSSVYAYGANHIYGSNQVVSREDALAALRAKKQNQDR